MGALVVALVTYALFFIPLPYYIVAPGAAVDLDDVVVVPGHPSPPGKVYLTDVTVMDGRPAFYAAGLVLPGYEIVPKSRIGPPQVGYRELNRRFDEMMKSSQLTAQAVAERAAGLPVRVASTVTVARTMPRTPATRCLQQGDRIVGVAGHAVSDAGDVQKVLRARPAGSVFTLRIERRGRPASVRCATARIGGAPRLGVYLDVAVKSVNVPVHVRYKIQNINGSSAGLMFALQIYRALKGRSLPPGGDVAGTGVIALDGSVTAVEGAAQKLRAAQKAGATVFLVPKENYQKIRGAPGMRIIPVSSFNEALAVLEPI